jgi:hypothetical protein
VKALISSPSSTVKKKKKEEINVVHPCNEAVLNNKNI